MTNDQDKDTKIELSPSQQDPGRAQPGDFKVTSTGEQGHGQSSPALIEEALRIHPNQPIPERNNNV